MKKRTEGALLISMIVGMTVIAVLGTAMVSVVTTSGQNRLKTNNANRSFYLAESGVRYAKANDLLPGTDQTYTLLNNGGKFHVVVTTNLITVTGIVDDTQALEARDTIVAAYSPPNPVTNEGYNSAGLYEFSTGSGGTAFDSSGNDNQGTVHNATWTTETPSGEGSAMHFETDTANNGQYVEVPDSDNSSLDLTTHGTLSAWIFIEKHNRYAGIIHKGEKRNFSDESYSLQMFNYNRLCISLNNGRPYMTSYTRLQTGEWYFVAGTWSPAGMALYINGVEDRRTTRTAVAISNNAPVYIGSQFSTSDGHFQFDGVIDRVGIFDRRMGEVELQEIYFGLKARWEFDTGSGIHVYDSATNFSPAFDGTINGYTNGTWVSSSPLGGYALSFCNTNAGIAYNDRQYVFGNDQIVTNFPFTLVNWYKTPPLPQTTKWGKHYHLLELSYDGLHVDDYVRYYSRVGRTGTNSQPITYMIERAAMQNQINDATWQAHASQTNLVTDDNTWHFQAANFRLYTNDFSLGDYNVCQYKSIYVDDTHVVQNKRWAKRHYSSLVNKWFIGAGRRYTSTGKKRAQAFFNGTLDKASVYSITLQPDVWSNMLYHIYDETKP